MFPQTPEDTDAAKRVYENDGQHMGFVMNLSRAWAWRADVGED
jgi:hypothetical protein